MAIVFGSTTLLKCNLAGEIPAISGCDVNGWETMAYVFMSTYLHGPLDEGTQLEVGFRTRGLDLKERRERFRKVDEDDRDLFKCDCGWVVRARAESTSWENECPLYQK